MGVIRTYLARPFDLQGLMCTVKRPGVVWSGPLGADYLFWVLDLLLYARKSPNDNTRTGGRRWSGMGKLTTSPRMYPALVDNGVKERFTPRLGNIHCITPYNGLQYKILQESRGTRGLYQRQKDKEDEKRKKKKVGNSSPTSSSSAFC